MHRKNLLIAIIGVMVVSTMRGLAGAGAESRVLVATVLSQSIFLDQLEPKDDVKHEQRAKLTNEQYDKWLLDSHDQALQAKIWQALMDSYCLAHACEPTEEELRMFNEGLEAIEATAYTSEVMRRSREITEKEIQTRREALVKERAALAPKDVRAQEISKQLEVLDKAEQYLQPEGHRQVGKGAVAREFIRTWKFNKALYQQYGGIVIWQQVGLEPIGAYQAWLAEQERSDAFHIHDPQFRARFWKYWQLTSTAYHEVVDDAFLKEAGLKNPFEKPWWLLKKPPANE